MVLDMWPREPRKVVADIHEKYITQLMKLSHTLQHEDPIPGKGMPGFDCLVDSLGVTAYDIHDEVSSGGSGHLSTGKYSIGIYSTGKDLVLSVSDKD
ncbi:hypothetical protein [Bifidobacterium coryneforme]|uniref:hypothetical protein n=1 Tax=Bifidobacterium coryneforme TaxID=1687 RepID=UPI0023EFF198|nr:hypothetical protein [Bifidobacterium coryneforme]